MQEETIHIHENKLIIDGKAVEIGGLSFEKEISRGEYHESKPYHQ